MVKSHPEQLSSRAMISRSIRRPRWATSLMVAACIVYIFVYLQPGAFSFNHLRVRKRLRLNDHHDLLPPSVPCLGPRGEWLSETLDDETLKKRKSVKAHPIPFMGSHRELGLSESWMTADDRYGPYGFGENKPSYKRPKVDWDSTDWGHLMDQCLHANSDRFPGETPSARVANDTRFTLRDAAGVDPTSGWKPSPVSTHRTALVLRSFEKYRYSKEHMWMIRSLITETALRSGGRYGVILLVNVQNKRWKIHESQENYDRAFAALDIPPELRSITLLWDDQLLESWYPLVDEHRSMWQINQPLQLLALHYPEYDHYWQLEMDQRFMGDALEYFDALANFARAEPRKQSLERATYPYSEEVYSSYDDLLDKVDSANHGKSRAWGAMQIPDVQPIGPQPPTPRSESENFSWGVGEEADVIVTSFCEDVRDAEWVFRDWYEGTLHMDNDTPRFFCPPAISRASRTLLRAIHAAQYSRGLSIPSEATLPSWALWLGLKLSYPPQPVYMHRYDKATDASRPDGEKDETSRVNKHSRHPDMRPFFGDTPKKSRDGLAHGNPQAYGDRGLTHWWTSDYPRTVMDAWLGNKMATEDLPSMLVVRNGEVYAPNFAMHPVKVIR